MNSDDVNSAIGIYETLRQHGEVLAIVLGFLVSISLTQFVKQLRWFPSKRWLIRAMAVPLGAVVTFSAWPVHEFTAIRFWIAVAVGGLCPPVYQAATWAIYKFWPGAEKHLSAAPRE